MVKPVETGDTVVRFTLGGILFEYDPGKNRKILRNTEYPSRAQPVCFSIMIVLNYTMRLTAGMKTAMIR